MRISNKRDYFSYATHLYNRLVQLSSFSHKIKKQHLSFLLFLFGFHNHETSFWDESPWPFMKISELPPKICQTWLLPARPWDRRPSATRPSSRPGSLSSWRPTVWPVNSLQVWLDQRRPVLQHAISGMNWLWIIKIKIQPRMLLPRNSELKSWPLMIQTMLQISRTG